MRVRPAAVQRRCAVAHGRGAGAGVGRVQRDVVAAGAGPDAERDGPLPQPEGRRVPLLRRRPRSPHRCHLDPHVPPRATQVLLAGPCESYLRQAAAEQGLGGDLRQRELLHVLLLPALRELPLHVMKDLSGKPLKEAAEDRTLPLCWRGGKPFRFIAEARRYFKPLTLSFPQGKRAILDISPEGYLILTVKYYYPTPSMTHGCSSPRSPPTGSASTGHPQQGGGLLPTAAPLYHGLVGVFLCKRDLAMNQLTGDIPRLIYWNEVLQYLGLRGNSLTGTLSPDMCQLTGLWYFDVRGNNISGTIPESIGNCTSFEILDISYNQITGEIPYNIGFLQVATLPLQGNRLTGTIPEVIGLMQALAVLSFLISLISSRCHLLGVVSASSCFYRCYDLRRSKL